MRFSTATGFRARIGSASSMLLVLALLAVLTLIAMNVFKPREHKEVADVDRRPPGHEAV